MIEAGKAIHKKGRPCSKCQYEKVSQKGSATGSEDI